MVDSDANLADYYSRRAEEYERIYHRDDPVRQAEQAKMGGAIGAACAGRSVLEVACGTGYWTTFAARTAWRVTATDVSPEVLAIARRRVFPTGHVAFAEADAYALDTVPGAFDAGLATFWFSHVPKTRLSEFLRQFHERLEPRAAVFMADNAFIPGIGGQLVSRPGVEDTFKLRCLADGSEHEVLKNYYDAEQLRDVFDPLAADLSVHVGQCFWWVRYTVAPHGSS